MQHGYTYMQKIIKVVPVQICFCVKSDCVFSPLNLYLHIWNLFCFILGDKFVFYVHFDYIFPITYYFYTYFFLVMDPTTTRCFGAWISGLS